MPRRLERLFQPIGLGSLELPNRIIMPAITTNYDFDKVGRLESFYAERARGGAGLIITGALQTLHPGKRSQRGKVSEGRHPHPTILEIPPVRSATFQ